MKRTSSSIVLALFGLLTSASTTATAQAQPSNQVPGSVVAVVAEALSLPFVPPDQRPLYGTYWEVRNTLPCVAAPMPCPPSDPGTPVYAIGDPALASHFLVDETAGPVIVPLAQPYRQMILGATDPAAILQAQAQELQNFVAQAQEWQANAQLRANGQLGTVVMEGPDGGGFFGPMGFSFTPEDLWLELSSVTTNTGVFIVHPPEAEARSGVYDLFMTTNLGAAVPGLNLTNWYWVLRTQPGETNLLLTAMPNEQAFFRLGRTNDTDGDGMSDAYEQLVTHTDPNHTDAPIILVQPLSQQVDQGDTVTFAVVAGGGQPLAYQWFVGAAALAGETNSSLTLPAADFQQQGDYSVLVTSSVGLSTLSSNATLTVQVPYNWPLVTLTGQRQNYTFRNGITYYIGSRVELFGVTTIQGGATIKPDSYYPDSTLAVMGTLVCKTDDPYFPAFLTSVDDDTLGEPFIFSTGHPVAATNGAPYLDLTCAQDPQPSLNNLRIRYADQAIGAPVAKTVDIWNCQFLRCNSAVVAAEDSRVAFHNVLIGACATAVSGTTNFAAVVGEHLTADATNFWVQGAPSRIALTNSIVVGSVASGPALVTDHTATNPTPSAFRRVGSANYYLTNSSPYRHAGTTAVSPRLLVEFRQKSTQAPVVFPAFWELNGEMTLGRQAERYTSGPPDYGYYYPGLDYTVAWLANWGSITILPGTVVGFRHERPSPQGQWTRWGFDLREGSSFTSRATPNQPNAFVDVQLVQEQWARPCYAFFVPDFWPDAGPNHNAAPVLDFRFSKFYANSRWYHLWSGYDAFYQYLFSPDSRVDWTMRDCSLHGGRITLGEPDNLVWYGLPPDWLYGECAVSWRNNLFDSVAIDLDPTFYKDGLGLNCDMAFEAYNNLFRGGSWLHLEPIPASAGTWTFKDNLFDKVDFIQDTNAPLDFNCNGYWPLSSAELSWAWYYYPWSQTNTGQLLVTTNGGGGNERVLSAAPPYQPGPLGDHYLPIATGLYHAGSRTANDAGLFHYTSRLDQIKEGEEIPGHAVSIGLHYVAVTNGAPKDYDDDGIPDYLENWHGDGNYAIHTDTETDWQTNFTVDGIYDPTNLIYDDRDLSGSGLTGLAKKALGLSPLDPENPLTLTPIITGDEPIVVTFEVPVSYDAVTAAGFFHLNMDGFGATGEQLLRATNGRCLLVFNQYFDPPGPHLLCANFQMGGLAADGRILPFYSTNELQFEEAGAMFDEYSAYLDAKVFADQVDYAINLYDNSTTNETFILTITNTTYNHMIQEDWGVTNADGTPFTGTSVRAEFDLAPGAAGRGASKPSKPLQRAIGSLSEWGLNFNVAYMYTPTNGVLSTAFAKGGDVWNGMQGVVDYLIAPRYGWDHYNSDFNRYAPPIGSEYPGYLTSRAMVTNNLYPTLTGAKQFYCCAHGTNNWMSNAGSDTYMKASEIGGILQNWRSNNVIIANNPYCFVFLDGCSTASGLDWQAAFGVAEKGEATRNKTGPQAFVGWAKPVADWMGGLNDPVQSVKLAKAYTKTLQRFYLDWMTKVPLATCIDHASLSLNDTVPLPVSQNKNCLINFSDGTTYLAKNLTVARIIIAGRPGLRVDGVDQQDDSRKDYARR